MKHHPTWIIVAALVIVVAAASYNSASAEESPPTGLSPAEVALWSEELRQAGGSRAEIGQFEELLRLQSPVGRNAPFIA